jgi:hypothetical protein
MVVINDVVFVHGGLSPLLLELQPDEVNRVAMGELRGFVASQQRLLELGVLGPQMSYAEQVVAVNQLAHDRAAARSTEPKESVELARTMFELGDGLVFRPDGPLWYRGTSLNPDAEERPLVDEVLAHLGAASVVVGHTPSHTTRVVTRFDDRVVMADTGMLASHYEGRPSAVEIRNGQLLAVYPGEGERVVAAQRWELTGDRFSGDADLEEFLRTAQVVWKEEVGSGSTRPLQIGLADAAGGPRRSSRRSTPTGAATSTRWRPTASTGCSGCGWCRRRCCARSTAPRDRSSSGSTTRSTRATGAPRTGGTTR